MAWMYILECADGSYYVGSTKDLERRMAEHLSGLGPRYTSGRLPVKLVYGEEYDRISDAYYHEKQVQNWSRAKREAWWSRYVPRFRFDKLSAAARNYSTTGVSP